MENVQVRVYTTIIVNVSTDKVQVLIEPHTLEEKKYFIRHGIRSQRITLTANQYRKLENIKELTIEEFSRILLSLIPQLVVKHTMIQGIVEGIQIEWPEIDIKYEDIRYEGIKHNREYVSVVEGIMYMLTFKPNWICKGSKSGNFSDRLIMGFDDKKMVIYEGIGATYKILKDGLKYYNTQEKLKDIRKKIGVDYICHTSKSKWLTIKEKWFSK